MFTHEFFLVPKYEKRTHLIASSIGAPWKAHLCNAFDAPLFRVRKEGVCWWPFVVRTFHGFDRDSSLSYAKWFMLLVWFMTVGVFVVWKNATRAAWFVRRACEQTLYYEGNASALQGLS